MDTKVLILSCGTGGGHNTAARAIQEDLKANGIQADFIEYLEIINSKVKDKVNKLYIKSTRKNGKIFKNVYKLGELYEKTKLKSPVYILNSLNKNRLYEYIVENHYKYVITTHLFAAQALTAIKKEHDIHFMQVATDYVSIPFWEETNPDFFVIPNKELEKNFTKPKIKKEILLPYGIPVMKDYRQEYDKDECKKSLGLQQEKQYILISNGSMGFGDIIELTKELEKEIKDVIFIVSCGNNQELLKKLQNTYKNNNRVIPLGYVNNLSQYMKSSDIILTKPGGLTSTEAASTRKPLVHIMPIPGCENYNANFFSQKKMSLKCNNTEEIIENTKELLRNKELQEELISNQKKYIHHDTCEKITNIIIEKLNKRG